MLTFVKALSSLAFVLTLAGCAAGGSLETRAMSLPRMQTASALSFSPDGQLLAGSVERAYVVWDVAGAREIARLDSQYESVYGRTPAFTPDGRRLLVQPKPSYRPTPQPVLAAWNFTDNRIEGEIFGAGVRDYEVSATRRELFVLNQDASLAVYDGESLQLLRSWTVTPQRPPSLAVSPDGARVAVAGRIQCNNAEAGTTPVHIWIYDAVSGEMVATTSDAHNGDATLAWLGTKTLVSAASQSSRSGSRACGGTWATQVDADPIVLWDPSTGDKMHGLTPPFAASDRLAAGSDGRYLAVAGYVPEADGASRVALWRDEAVVHTWEEERGKFNALAITRDGRFAAISRTRYPAAYGAIVGAAKVAEPLGMALFLALLPLPGVLEPYEEILLVSLPLTERPADPTSKTK